MRLPPLRNTLNLIFLTGLWLAIGLLYMPALNDAVLFDDAQIIRGGALRSDLLTSAPRFVTNLSYVLVDVVFDKSTVAQKVCNLALHATAVTLLYFLTLTLFEIAPKARPVHGDGTGRIGKTALCLGVALFALNPSAVYATAYLVQRSIVLATIFTILMLVLFIWGLKTGNKFHFAGSAVFYVLAVLSKELSVMAIFIPPLIYIAVRAPSPKRVGVVMGGTLLVAGLVAGAFLRQYNISLLSPYEPAAAQYLSQAGLPLTDHPIHVFSLHLINQLNLFFAYGLLWVFPHPHWMSIDLQPVFPTVGSAWRYIPLSLCFLLLFMFATRLLFKPSARTRLVGLLVLIPMVLFQTEFWIVRVQEPFAIYRSYLWAISLPGLMALAFSYFNKRQLLVAGSALVIWQTGVAMTRVQTFANDLAIWSDAIEKSTATPYFRGFGVWRQYINRGSAHLNRGDVRHALQDFHRADNLGALHGVGQYNIGVVLHMLGSHREALHALQKAESNNKRDPLLQYRIGEVYYALHMHHEALKSYQNAVALGSDHESFFLASLRAAEVQILLGQFTEANQSLSKLSNLEPGNQRIDVGLGMANFGLGNIEVAQAFFERSLKQSANANANAYYGLALIRESQAKHDEAHGLVEKAISMEPNNSAFTELKAHLSQLTQQQNRP